LGSRPGAGWLWCAACARNLLVWIFTPGSREYPKDRPVCWGKGLPVRFSTMVQLPFGRGDGLLGNFSQEILPYPKTAPGGLVYRNWGQLICSGIVVFLASNEA